MQVSPDEHLVFSHTIDALFREVLFEHVSDDVKQRMKAVGLDLSRPLDPAYPLRVFDDAMEVVAVHGLSHLDKRAALKRIGELQIEAFARTLIGRATVQFARILPLERVLGRLTKSFRNANNFIEATVEKVDATHYRVSINDVGRFPEVFEGILQAVMTLASVRATVTAGQRDGLACTYELRVAS